MLDTKGVWEDNFYKKKFFHSILTKHIKVSSLNKKLAAVPSIKRMTFAEHLVSMAICDRNKFKDIHKICAEP